MTKQWIVETPHEHYTQVTSEHVRINSGCLEFTDGDIFNSEVVALFAVDGWVACSPMKIDHVTGCECDDVEEDE